VADVEATLGIEVAVSVPSSRSITLSTNDGVPLVLSDPGSSTARPFDELVGRFTDVPAARAGGFSRFRRSAR